MTDGGADGVSLLPPVLPVPTPPFPPQAGTVGRPAAHILSFLTSPSTPFRVAVARLPRGAARDGAAVHRAVAAAALPAAAARQR